MAITVILRLTVKENKLDKLENMLKQYLPETRKYKGFIDISIHHQIDSNNVVFYSKWDEKKDYENYLNWRIETGVMNKLSEVLDSEPDIRFYNTLNI